jgi:hypothetical protein
MRISMADTDTITPLESVLNGREGKAPSGDITLDKRRNITTVEAILKLKLLWKHLI